MECKKDIANSVLPENDILLFSEGDNESIAISNMLIYKGRGVKEMKLSNLKKSRRDKEILIWPLMVRKL